jgi:hypothetical protein
MALAQGHLRSNLRAHVDAKRPQSGALVRRSRTVRRSSRSRLALNCRASNPQVSLGRDDTVSPRNRRSGRKPWVGKGRKSRRPYLIAYSSYTIKLFAPKTTIDHVTRCDAHAGNRQHRAHRIRRHMPDCTLSEVRQPGGMALAPRTIRSAWTLSASSRIWAATEQPLCWTRGLDRSSGARSVLCA